MGMRILVLHGPNLNLLGEREGDEPGKNLEDLNQAIRTKAAAYGLDVKIFQSNHEGELVDTLHAERRWADGVIVNPAALTHSSYALREGLVAIGKPAVEVHLTDIRRREAGRGKSVLKEVCAAQVTGKGFDSYLIALQRFATGDLTGRKKRAKEAEPAKARALSPAKPEAGQSKTLGRSTPAQVSLPRSETVRKTIGPAAAPGPRAAAEKMIGAGNRAAAESSLGRPAVASSRSAGDKTLGRAAPPEKGPAAGLLNRALVRQKIADRLSGKLSPAGLATWARGQWFEVRRGAPAESGHREVLEDSLQSLVLSTLPASRLSDDQLIDLMTQLDG